MMVVSGDASSRIAMKAHFCFSFFFFFPHSLSGVVGGLPMAVFWWHI